MSGDTDRFHLKQPFLKIPCHIIILLWYLRQKLFLLFKHLSLAMIILKKTAATILLLIVATACHKDNIDTDYAGKLMGYYTGDIDQSDTLTINGSATPVKYDSWLRFFIQKSAHAPFAIKYATNTNYIVNGYIYTGSTEAEGLLENISLNEDNAFFINETPAEFWGKQVLLKGIGKFDEQSNSLSLNLSVNDNGKIRQLNLNLPRQKRLD